MRLAPRAIAHRLADRAPGVRPSSYRDGMGSLAAQLHDVLGYDPDDGVPQLAELDARALAVGALVAARDGAVNVAVARLASGKLVVVDDVCPHDGGRISDGFVDGERLVCARHGWELTPCGRRCERVLGAGVRLGSTSAPGR